MIVCHCRGLSDRQIRRVVRGGARTRRAVARACGASADCGGCTLAIHAILEREHERQHQRHRQHDGAPDAASPLSELAAAVR